VQERFPIFVALAGSLGTFPILSRPRLPATRFEACGRKNAPPGTRTGSSESKQALIPPRQPA
jgi:hypothetical protein